MHFNAFQRGVDIPNGTAGRPFFAHHVPWFQRAAQRQLNAVGFDLADQRKTEFEMRFKPGHVEAVSGFSQLGQHVRKVHADQAWEQKAVVQLGAPARHAAVVGLCPEASDQRAQQQLLGNAHAGVRRHFEGAQLQQAQAAGG